MTIMVFEASSSSPNNASDTSYNLIDNSAVHCQGWKYRLVIDGVILYFSFIEYRFVSTYSLSISNPAH